MKKNEMNDDEKSLFGNVCVKYCRRIATQIGKSRDAIFAEARVSLKLREHMVRLALNEAEAIAWQTLYPHLLFPVLATEKVREIAAWNTQQQEFAARRRALRF